MAFEQIEIIGQGAGLGAEDRDTGARVAGVDSGQIVVAMAQTRIDQPEIAGSVQHVAKGGEGGGGQRF